MKHGLGKNGLSCQSRIENMTLPENSSLPTFLSNLPVLEKCCTEEWKEIQSELALKILQS